MIASHATPHQVLARSLNMKKLLRPLLLVCAFAFIAVPACAQGKTKTDLNPGSIAKGTGKAAVIVVGSAAKVAWGVTKLTGKYVVLPVAKTVFLKAAPAIGKFAFKKSLKYVAPTALKLSAL